jgi:hypothetical protein
MLAIFTSNTPFNRRPAASPDEPEIGGQRQRDEQPPHGLHSSGLAERVHAEGDR